MQTTAAIPMLIDTDPGVDDALALLMAFDEPSVRVVALTILAGNVGLGHTVANALKICEVAGVPVPVHAGCPVPLVHPAADAAFVHGQDGFGDVGFAPAAQAPDPEHAALALLRHSHAEAGRLVLVALGPLTNIALALRLDPTLPSRVARLVVMGGAVTGQGNTTVPAEFNVGFDPEAARVVFEAFPRFEIVDWEAVLRHGFAHVDFDAWLAAGDARARFYDAISRKTRAWSGERRGEFWHAADALAMAVALAPGDSRRSARHHVDVELEGRLTRGQTVVDWQDRGGRPPNALIHLDVDQAAFEARIRRALGVS
jgi:purine nucleosidase